MWPRLVAVCLVLAGCGKDASPQQAPTAVAPPVTPALERVDVFGSKQLDRATLIARWGDELAGFVRDADAGNDNPSKYAALESKIQQAGSFALVNISVLTYYYPSRRAYATVDLVDEADRARRMAFAAEPTGTHPDPDNLIALWDEYETKQRQLVQSAKITSDALKNEKCPFWHCMTFAHESLVPYRDAFAARVPAVESQLVEVLRDDRRDSNRAAAAFLLTHLASGPHVVELLLPSIRDPGTLVRNNVLRVLTMISWYHPEVPIPVEPVIAALQFPLTLDRNKSSAILKGISQHASAEVRAQIKAGAGDVLVDMLALRQPNNHDFAYEILKNISGRDLGEHAVEAWRAWVREPVTH